jgi:dipeptidyl aminopeptidase/acylaminoacyl peptidase
MHRREFLLGAGAVALPCRAADSPLGTIAYLQTDGLWVRDLPDGRPRKIAAPVKTPRFSPSTEWIAFDGGVVRSDGTASAALPPGRSVWMPGQDVLAIPARGDLLLFSPRNGWSTPTTTHKGVVSPVFNADGSQFAYSNAVRTGTGPGGEPMRNGQLRRAAVDGAESRTLLSRYLVQPIPYCWTRDSRFILYWEDPDFSASVMTEGLPLYRVPAAGGPPEPLGVETLVHEDLLALSPTGNHLAATAGGGRETYERKRIAIVDLESLAVRYLTGGNTSAIAPSWSPEGRRLAYVQAPAPPAPGPQYRSDNLTARPYMQQRRIWLADASGVTPPRAITADSRYRDEEPLWSADGAHILFCRMDAAGTGALWVMGAEGDNPIPVSATLPLNNSWIGFYGYIDWRSTFDWHRP